MADIKRVPQLWIHEFELGASCTGVAPAGAALVDSDETVDRGAQRLWSGLDDGGLFQLPVALTCGWRVNRVMWNLPGLTKFDLYAVDADGFSYVLLSGTAVSGMIDFRDPQVLLVPGWALQVVAATVAGFTGAGRIVVEGQQGLWLSDAFVAFRRGGREARV
jgi:hypothetical protein